MPTPQNITSEAQLGAENTYLLEKDPPALVQGVLSNNVGIVGECVRGPADKIVKIGDPGRFAAVFGGRDYGGGGGVVSDVWQFVLKRTFGDLYVVRAVASDATTAEADFLATATPIVNIAASSPGVWGNSITVTIGAATDGDANHWNLTVNWLTDSITYENLDTTAGNDNLVLTIGDDDSNLVVVTKLADGRPDNAVDQALDDTIASDGTIADTDFTAAGKGIPLLAAKKEANIVCVAGRMNATIKSAMNTEASAAGPGKLFLVDPDSENVTQATYETEVNGFTASDRLIACFNHTRLYDPNTGGKLWQQPSALMASVLSQFEANVHPGVEDDAVVALASGTIELANEMSEADYKSARENRISAIERVALGYVFRSGVTTLPGTKGEITARRQKDFLILSAADRVAKDVKRPNSQENRDVRAAAIGAFLETLARNGEYIGTTDGAPDFIYDTEGLNNDADRANGIQRDRMSVRLIPHNLWLILVTTIDTANAEFFTEEG